MEKKSHSRGTILQSCIDDGIKKKASRSLIWNYFTKSGNPNNPTCKCNHCGKEYTCDSKNGTSTFWNHLEGCFRYQNSLVEGKQKTLTLENNKTKNGGSNLVAVGFNKEACRKACMRMIILDELPFSFVEGEGFREFCSVACPKFDPPSRRTIARDIYQLYLDEKESLKRLFTTSRQRVCLTTDTWTSLQNVNYMVVTSHFINSEWQLNKRILSFCVIPNHKGETIGKLIESCLLDWGIERLFTITVDNATSNNTAISYIKRKLKNWHGDGLVLNGEFLHLKCCAHILNLIVSEGLKDIHHSIDCIRHAVRYVKSSPTRFKKFKACVEHEKIDYQGLLVLDVPTRWNSTYLMLESALKFQKAFDRLEEDDGQYVCYFLEDDTGKKKAGPPKCDDWEKAQIFVKFLKMFYDVTLKFSSSLFVNSNLFFHEMCEIHAELKTLSGNEDDLLSKTSTNMKRKFDKYWGSFEIIPKLLMISVVLDPRYKLQYVSFCFDELYGSEKVEEMTKEIKDLLQGLYCFYGGAESFSAEKLVSEVEMKKETDEGSQRVSHLSKFRRLLESRDCMELSTEIDRYLLEPVEYVDDANFDILIWWKMNSLNYRTLSCVAKDVFAIPISTVASESAFSTGGRILDSFRSSLSPKMVEVLICTQNWLRSSRSSINNELIVEEMKFYETLESGSMSMQQEVNRRSPAWMVVVPVDIIDLED